MSVLDDTQEMDLSELQDDPEALKIESHLPKPAVVRAAVVGVVSLVAAVLGKDLDVSWLNPLLDAYIVATPAVLGWWLHRKTEGAAVATKAAVEAYVGKHRKL